jgi:tetratricopeptide (TPR) repeat protein
MKERFREAKRILDRKIKFQLSNSKINILYGRLYDQWSLKLKGKKKKEMQKKAENYFKKACKDPRTKISGLRGLALVAMHQNKLKKACSLYQKVFKQIKNAQTCNDMGNIYRKLGKIDKAIDCYKQSLSLAKNEEMIAPLYNLILTLREKKDFISSKKYEKELKKISKDFKTAKLMFKRLKMFKRLNK